MRGPSSPSRSCSARWPASDDGLCRSTPGARPARSTTVHTRDVDAIGSRRSVVLTVAPAYVRPDPRARGARATTSTVLVAARPADWPRRPRGRPCGPCAATALRRGARRGERTRRPRTHGRRPRAPWCASAPQWLVTAGDTAAGTSTSCGIRDVGIMLRPALAPGRDADAPLDSAPAGRCCRRPPDGDTHSPVEPAPKLTRWAAMAAIVAASGFPRLVDVAPPPRSSAWRALGDDTHVSRSARSSGERGITLADDAAVHARRPRRPRRPRGAASPRSRCLSPPPAPR